MSILEEQFNFIYPWRSYQKRFLDHFESNFEDRHLHVVAPPGSGKTVLGLEMVKRVNQQTLILAPTLTIRNQWEERMFECFVPKEKCIVALSRNIKQPAFLTFSTYQSLHAFYKNEMKSDGNALVNFFAKAGIKNIVLDEAHHLKNEWWKPLLALKDLPDCSIIALTATPPYDSEQREIAKYFELCGPIDEEIGVPELVKEGNLCPHQDYIHFSQPSAEEIQYIIAYRERLMNFVNDLVADQAFKKFILKNPLYTHTTERLEEVYDRSEFFAAMLVYLHATGHDIPKNKFKILGIPNDDTRVPNFTYKWVDILLQEVLIDRRELLFPYEVLLDPLEKKLRRIGGLRNKKVHLEGEKDLFRSISQSPNKLKGIQEIIVFELRRLGPDLRAVILADYIRKEFLEVSLDTLDEINKLGVIPVFQYVRSAVGNSEEMLEKLAVPTGSLIVIHAALEPYVKERMPANSYRTFPLDDTGFIDIKVTENGKNEMTSVMTELFTAGHIRVLMGTTALLGEGWDAPAINTLIMASYVGSFVMSNQMRGRAIRVQANTPDKVASIWHLASVDPTVQDGGYDVHKLRRRFEAFAGVSLEGSPYIENGVDRFGIESPIQDVAVLNKRMFGLAKSRDEVKQRWETAINNGDVLVRELKIDFSHPEAKKQRKVRYKDAVKFVFIELLVTLTIMIPELLLKNIMTYWSKGLVYFFYAILSSIGLVFLPKTFKAVRLYLKFGRIDKRVHKIAKAVLAMMREKKLFTTEENEFSLQIESIPRGELTCFLKGASEKESALFVQLMDEILSPVDNPRYLLVRRSWIQRLFGFTNYLSVPKLFGAHKKEATLFYKYWVQYNGSTRMIFTRTENGRKVLIKARFYYLNSKGGLQTKKAAIWK